MPRILIVDDERPIRHLLSLAFSVAGFDVRTAGDGREAVGLCSEETFDAVLSDVLMPEMNGHDLAQWIADHRPGTRTFLMSGYDQDCRQCPISERCRVLSKPFRPTEAVAMVQEALA